MINDEKTTNPIYKINTVTKTQRKRKSLYLCVSVLIIAAVRGSSFFLESVEYFN